jgi:tetratricopeptide (TPR) repeat protein
LTLIFLALFYDSWVGNTRIGATIQFQRAMNCGNEKSTVFYGRKLVNHYTNREGKITYPFVLTKLGWAYELNNEYEQALGVYQSYLENDNEDENNAINVARIYYKQKRYTESFQKYCSIVSKPKYQGKTGNAYIRNDIMCRHFGKAKKYMCPFENYEQFKMFIMDEYNKSECSEKYIEAVKKFNDE